MTDSKDNRYKVPALARGLDILCAFNRKTPELSAPELTKKLDLPRSTVFRLLQTLEAGGFLESTQDGRKYRLGVGVLRMGFEFLASQSVVEVGRPLVNALSQETNLAANLVIRDGQSIVYVISTKPRSAFASSITVGTRLPAHATVFGRVLLGDCSLAQLGTIFPDTLTSTSKQTPDSIAALHAMCRDDAARGFGISEGFYEPNISTVAVPVRDHNNRITAAVGLTITHGNVSQGLIDTGIVESVINTAAELSLSLGYPGNNYQQALRNATALISQRQEGHA